MDTPFEVNGMPSLSGWQQTFPASGYGPVRYTFSNDVPSGGGVWSLQLYPPGSAHFTILGYTARPKQAPNEYRFRLTYWHKTSLPAACTVGLSMYLGSEWPAGVTKAVTPGAWAQDTLMIGGMNKPDSVTVSISMFEQLNPADTTQSVLIDNCRIEQY